MLLALRCAFCADLRIDSGLCCIVWYGLIPYTSMKQIFKSLWSSGP